MSKLFYAEQTGILGTADIKKICGEKCVNEFITLNGLSAIYALINQIDHDFLNRSIGTTSITVREARELIALSDTYVLKKTGELWVKTHEYSIADVIDKNLPTEDIGKYKVATYANTFALMWADDNLICYVGAAEGKFRKNLRLHVSLVTGISICPRAHVIIDKYTMYLNKRKNEICTKPTPSPKWLQQQKTEQSALG